MVICFGHEADPILLGLRVWHFCIVVMVIGFVFYIVVKFSVMVKEGFLI